MDVELVINAIEMSKTADHLVIFSGDGNFMSLVVALQRKDARSQWCPPWRRGRREVDHFIDLVELRDHIDTSI